MLNILRWLKDLLCSRQEASPPEDTEAAFAEKYRNFRALLTANNNALEVMAQMEQMLISGQVFSMAFVRTGSTAVMVNVYKMVTHLLAMSAGRYAALEKSFALIQQQMNNLLEQQRIPSKGEWLLPISAIDRGMADQVGEKMANLGEVANRVGLLVPPGFALTAAAGQYFLEKSDLQDEINRRLQTLDPDNLESLYTTSAAIQRLIARATLPRELQEAIEAGYDRLTLETNPGLEVALRSSALGEDTGRSSFAGQYRTELHVCREFLADTFKKIIASKYSSPAIIYRIKKGYRDEDVAMGVGCLAMVDAVKSGVSYSRDPRNLRGSWVMINAVAGLPRSVVEGTNPTDMYLVSREEPHPIVKKHLRPGAGDDHSTLTDGQAQALTKIALVLEGHFGLPQDIEWSIDKSGRIIILQSRPLSAESETAADIMPLEEDGTPHLFSGGVTASPGVACGPVHIVRSNVDLLQFLQGEVLVTAHPLPQWAPLLNRAVAVLTETGSIAGHLATVAREFGVPALFGLAGVTDRLADNEVITVDSTGRCVYAGREEKVLANPLPPPNLMEGSPVQQVFKKVLLHISPLNLTDPNSPYFRPTECKTLHDITRFCHEKAVIEMFHRKTSKQRAKRLMGERATDWWIINLGDGFRPDFDNSSQTIQITDIVSEPMLAIWGGITAIPWEGPPPVNLRGFGSILFRSAMNPSLDPAVPSTMNAQNYFLVSRDFCNLSVRLGYHFAMVEAYVSDLLTESYVSFTFKGGAASDYRRYLRVSLIAEILEQFDFRIDRQSDALTARIERQTKDFILDRLRIIGHITIHTRQIDMVMDENTVRQYKKKLLSEIEMIRQGNVTTQESEFRIQESE